MLAPGVSSKGEALLARGLVGSPAGFRGGASSKEGEWGEVSVGTDGAPIERGNPLPGPTRQGCCRAQLAALVRKPSRDGAPDEGFQVLTDQRPCDLLEAQSQKPRAQRSRPAFRRAELLRSRTLNRIAIEKLDPIGSSCAKASRRAPSGSENPRGAPDRGESASEISHRRAALPAHQARRVRGLRSRLPPRSVPRAR